MALIKIGRKKVVVNGERVNLSDAVNVLGIPKYKDFILHVWGKPVYVTYVLRDVFLKKGNALKWSIDTVKASGCLYRVVKYKKGKRTLYALYKKCPAR